MAGNDGGGGAVVDADGRGGGAEAQGGEFHRDQAPLVMRVRSKCRRSTMGASENMNRLRSVPADTDQGTQDGTTIRSPLATACIVSPSWNCPAPSNTWKTRDPTSRRVLVWVPAR